MQKNFPKTLIEVKEWFKTLNPTVLSLDTETTGLDFDCDLMGISLCDGLQAGYINLEKHLYREFILAELINLLENTSLLIMHNSPFDLRVLKQHGVEYTGKLYDTQVASHLLNENTSCALKDIVKRKKFEGWETAIEFKEAVDNGYSSDKFLNYAISDAIWAFELYKLTKPLLIKQELWSLFTQIEMPFQYVLVEFYLNGVKIDTKKLSEFDSILTKEREKAERNCVESINLKMIEEKTLFGLIDIKSPINLSSSQQLAKIIEGQLGIELPKTDPSDMYPEGQASTSADVLEPLKGKHPFIRYLLRFRKCEKLLNTFIQPLYGKINKDGRLRTSYNDCVARTGRLSSSGPNLQNIPKELSEDDIVNIRELFIADKDKIFVRADYDLQEIRQLANVTGDKNLIHVLNSGQDIHLASANGCLNLGLTEQQLIKTDPEFEALKKRYKKERHIGKNGINFPVIYGSTCYGVALNNNVSEEEAQEWIDGFHNMYPEVRVAIKKCEQELIHNHCVTTYFNRRRRFNFSSDDVQQYRRGRGGPFAHQLRQAFNVLIQGFCADLLRITLIKLLECYRNNPEWGAKLTLTIHDDCISEVNPQYANEVLKAKKEIMENAVNLQVKFLVDIGVCDSYGG